MQFPPNFGHVCDSRNSGFWPEIRFASRDDSDELWTCFLFGFASIPEIGGADSRHNLIFRMFQRLSPQRWNCWRHTICSIIESKWMDHHHLELCVTLSIRPSICSTWSIYAHLLCFKINAIITGKGRLSSEIFQPKKSIIRRNKKYSLLGFTP